jgi:integrase
MSTPCRKCSVAKVCLSCRIRHDRHTFGTLLNANGENPKVVQELLRHASLKVTTDVYMQAVGPQKREAPSNLVKLVRKGAVLEIKPA